MKQAAIKWSAGLLFLLVIALQACRTTKETPVTDNGSSPSEVERVVGTVEKSEDCGFYITVIQGDVMRSYFPVGFEDKYKVEGMKLKFAHQPAKAKMPQACHDFIPVYISEVTPVR